MKFVITTGRNFFVNDEICKKLILNNSSCIVRRNAESYYKNSKHPDLKGAKEHVKDIGDGVSKIRDNYFFHEEDVCYFSYADSARIDEEFISMLNDENIGDLKIIDIPSDIKFQIINNGRGEMIKEIIPFRIWT